MVYSANLKRMIENVPVEKKELLIDDNNEDIKLAVKAVNVGTNIIHERKNIEIEKNKLIADEALNRYREALFNVNNPNEFDAVANMAENDVKKYFNQTQEGKEFWNKFGNTLIQKNSQDIENIRKQKEFDFGKRNLNQLLADNQNMLVRADKKRANLLFDEALRHIENTNFLSSEEKKEYRNNYLNRGILNVALKDTVVAKDLAKKFSVDETDNLFLKIDEIERIKRNEEAILLKRKQDDDYLNKSKKAFMLWKGFESGEISQSQYWLLGSELGEEFNSSEISDITDRPMVKAYQLIKEIKSNDNNELDVKKINQVSKYLMGAYKQNKLKLNEVSFLQDMLFSQGDESLSFDSEIDDLADSVFIKDLYLKNQNLRDVMENKASLALRLHDVYGEKKRELFNGFLSNGGSLTANTIFKIKNQALEETKKEFGFVESSDGPLSFSFLNSLIKQYYRGNDEANIWQRFYKEAPYVADKKELLIKIAKNEQSLELSYPKFDSWAEVVTSDLSVGDKFYYRGRLAVKQI